MKGYDEWRLRSPWNDCHEIGQHEGETCGRFEEPDEDAPRGYRPKPCSGVMVQDCGEIVCETCGELA